MVQKFEGGNALIGQWLRNKDTILFLGIWEQLNNPDFNSPGFEGIKNEAGQNSFYLSVKNGVALLLLLEYMPLQKEFQHLKDEEARNQSIEWSFQRALAKVNYRIHTDAINSASIN